MGLIKRVEWHARGRCARRPWHASLAARPPSLPHGVAHKLDGDVPGGAGDCLGQRRGCPADQRGGCHEEAHQRSAPHLKESGGPGSPGVPTVSLSRKRLMPAAPPSLAGHPPSLAGHPLHLACHAGMEAEVRALLRGGADCDGRVGPDVAEAR